MASPRAEITPEVLKWARERARYSPSDAARKAGTTEERYIKYEEGEETPTLKQLYKLSKAFRQSVGTFYLESPPEEKEPLKEMRRLSDVSRSKESPDLATAVEDVLQRRRNALEMFEDLGEDPPTWEIEATLDEDPESVGKRIRSFLGAYIEDQKEHGGPYQALNYWRGLIEEGGALCFQVPRVSIEEMRGFAVSKFPLPLVAVNRKDSPTARIFTLLHEVSHIALQDSILHEEHPSSQKRNTSKEGAYDNRSEQETERFCNEVAAATIVPKEHFLSLKSVRKIGKKGFWKKRDIKRLASVYNISPSVAVRRLYSFDRITDREFFSIVEELDDYSEKGQSSSGGGGNYYRSQLSELGRFYSNLAFQTYHNGSITLSKLSSVLDVKVDNIKRYQRELYE